MPSSVTGTRVVIGANGHIYLSFDDGTMLEYMSLADAVAAAREIDNDPDFARKLLIARFLTQSPDASNDALFRKTLIFDLSSPSPIKVQ